MQKKAISNLASFFYTHLSLFPFWSTTLSRFGSVDFSSISNGICALYQCFSAFQMLSSVSYMLINSILQIHLQASKLSFILQLMGFGGGEIFPVYFSVSLETSLSISPDGDPANRRSFHGHKVFLFAFLATVSLFIVL